jgi:glycosyltransferase involved in cell wall biosynthesis
MISQSVSISSAEKNIKVSVVIPVFNGEKFLEACLYSVVNQTFVPHEIIVVNDGSTDGSSNIIDQFRERNAIKVINKINGGQSSARNVGVQGATGDWIALLDQDDIWYPDHIEVMLRAFLDVAAPVGYIYGNLDRIDIDGNIVQRGMLDILGNHPKKHLRDCLGSDMFIVPSASLIRKDCFVVVGGFDELLSGYEDDDLFLRLFRAGYNGLYLERPVTQWRIYPSSTTYSPRMARSRMIYFRKLASVYGNDKLLNEYWLRDTIAPRFINNLVGRFKIAGWNNDIDSMKKYWKDIQEVYAHLKTSHSRKARLLSPLIQASIFLRLPNTAIALLSAAGW